MRNKFSRGLVLFLILGFYAVLYMATSKATPCNDECQKITRVDTLLQKKPYIQYVYNCKQNQLCIYVKDSIPQNWNTVADTACTIIKESGLKNYSINLISIRAPYDTLVKQHCP